MNRILVLSLVVAAVNFCLPSESVADLINTIGTSTVSASASEVRGGLGATDGFSNTSTAENGSGG